MRYTNAANALVAASEGASAMTLRPDLAMINPDLAAEGAALVELMRAPPCDEREGQHQCAICGEWVEDGADQSGCRHPLCTEDGDDTWRR